MEDAHEMALDVAYRLAKRAYKFGWMTMVGSEGDGRSFLEALTFVQENIYSEGNLMTFEAIPGFTGIRGP